MASQIIANMVQAWPGVVAVIGLRKELSFRVGGHEIGHLHGNTIAHFYFCGEVWHKLKTEGRIEHDPGYPGKCGPAQRRIGCQADLQDVVAMLRLNYEANTAR